MIEQLKEAAKHAFRVGRERNMFITIEIEPAGVCVRAVRGHAVAQERATWAQLEASPLLLAGMVNDAAELIGSEVA